MPARRCRTRPETSSRRRPRRHPHRRRAKPPRAPEATTLAANLLAQSGISGFRILGAEDVERLKADAAWKADRAVGTVSIVTSDTTTLDQIPGRLIANAAQACKGKFFSGALPDAQGGIAVARVFTACQNGADTLTVYYLGVPRSAGGFYVLTTSAKGSEQPAKDADQNLRSAVLKVLSKSSEPTPDKSLHCAGGGRGVARPRSVCAHANGRLISRNTWANHILPRHPTHNIRDYVATFPQKRRLSRLLRRGQAVLRAVAAIPAPRDGGRAPACSCQGV